jgi:putative hydrolase of the HAD superfamily
MIKAITFDCFGVLASDGWLPLRDKYFGGNPELIEKVTKLNREIDGGLSTYDDFIKRVSELAGLNESSVREQIENNIPDERLFQLIRDKIKPKYKLGMLSNAADNWLDEIFLPEQIKLFDAIALSYEMKVIKPDPKAYEIIAKRLNVEPSECLFVDDQERYCYGASKVGMQTIMYTNFLHFEEQIKPFLR